MSSLFGQPSNRCSICHDRPVHLLRDSKARAQQCDRTLCAGSSTVWTGTGSLSGDAQLLSGEMRRVVDLGAHVIFCWGERADALVPGGGNWVEIGRDFVWLSKSLQRIFSAAFQEQEDHRKY